MIIIFDSDVTSNGWAIKVSSILIGIDTLFGTWRRESLNNSPGSYSYLTLYFYVAKKRYFIKYNSLLVINWKWCNTIYVVHNYLTNLKIKIEYPRNLNILLCLNVRIIFQVKNEYLFKRILLFLFWFNFVSFKRVKKVFLREKYS